MSRLKAPVRRQQLIEVATLLFAERGYDATTTAAIAAGAGISEPILYRHFRSKQELFVQIIEEVTKATKTFWFDADGPTVDPAGAYRKVAATWPARLREDAAHYRVLHNALVCSRDPVIREKVKAHYVDLHGVFVGVVKHGQRTGVFAAELDVSTAAWWMLNNAVGFTLLHVSVGDEPGMDHAGAAELTLRGLAPGGGPGR